MKCGGFCVVDARWKNSRCQLDKLMLVVGKSSIWEEDYGFRMRKVFLLAVVFTRIVPPIRYILVRDQFVWDPGTTPFQYRPRGILPALNNGRGMNAKRKYPILSRVIFPILHGCFFFTWIAIQKQLSWKKRRMRHLKHNVKLACWAIDVHILLSKTKLIPYIHRSMFYSRCNWKLRSGDGKPETARNKCDGMTDITSTSRLRACHQASI